MCNAQETQAEERKSDLERQRRLVVNGEDRGALDYPGQPACQTAAPPIRISRALPLVRRAAM